MVSFDVSFLVSLLKLIQPMLGLMLKLILLAVKIRKLISSNSINYFYYLNGYVYLFIVMLFVFYWFCLMPESR